MIKRCYVVILLLMLMIPLSLRAQDRKTEYLRPVIFGMPSLSIAPDARGAGLGDIGVTTSADAASIHYNMSKQAFSSKKMGGCLSYTPWMTSIDKDMSVTYLSGYYTWDDYYDQAISGSLRYFNIGDAIAIGHSSPTETVIHPYEYALDLGYAIAILPQLALGASLRYAVSDMNFVSDQHKHIGRSFMMDISATYRDSLFIGSHSIMMISGLAINNMGAKYSYESSRNHLFLPTVMRLGIGGEMMLGVADHIGLHLEIDKYLVPTPPEVGVEGYDKYKAEYDNYSAFTGIMKSWQGSFSEKMKELSATIGAEYTYKNEFTGRLAYRYQHPSKGNNSGLYFGIGGVYSLFSLDVSYFVAITQDNPLNNTLRLSLGVGL